MDLAVVLDTLGTVSGGLSDEEATSRLAHYGPNTLPLAARSSRIVAGHPEGFPDGFANIYSDAAEVIAARRTGSAPDPLAMHFPTAEDGLLGVRFIERVLASSEKNGAWTAC